MSESHSETMNGSGVFETGGQFERPKSRLPRLPQPTPKPPETEAADLMQAVKSVQKAASASQLENKVNTHAVSVRQYLETNVVPILMKGLLTVVRERPEDPVDYLATFLMKNNPKKQESDDRDS